MGAPHRSALDETSEEGQRRARVEQRANAFAAELLLPAEGLRRLLGKPAYEMSVAAAREMVDRARREFATPIEITVNHLVHREYVVHWNREAIIREARAREPVRSGATAVTTRDVLTRRVVEALGVDAITEEKARELLGVSAWDALPAGG